MSAIHRTHPTYPTAHMGEMATTFTHHLTTLLSPLRCTVDNMEVICASEATQSPCASAMCCTSKVTQRPPVQIPKSHYSSRSAAWDS
jgi:hypothetical protein